MAPTSKSSAPTGNPAPDFTVNMNRIQMQLEARLKAARAFLPSRSDTSNTASGSSGSFSALHTSGPQAQAQLQQSREESARVVAARRQAQEAEFAEDRGLDPNAGIGLVPRASGAGGSESARDRDTAKLRGRLLGKRGRAGGVDGDGQYKWQRKEDSSDEEAGRGGLGRASRGKRLRADMEEDAGRRENSDATEANAPAELNAPAAREVEGQGDVAVDEEAAEILATKPTEEDRPNQPGTEGNSKKKRKKKKKKSKDKAEDS